MALPVAIGAGVLNDTDHLIDYYLWYIKKDHRKLYLLLHAWSTARQRRSSLSWRGTILSCWPLLLLTRDTYWETTSPTNPRAR